tara:strand:- start:17 stop:577 length:561 start_codon:yes stop_codon:yes gene_type:complete
MRPQKTLDEDVLAGLTEVFQSKGYEAASLQDLSTATGLKKASLYHRFPGGKKQMAEAVLEHLAKWVGENVFQVLRNSEHSPEIRLKNAMAQVKVLYDDGKNTCIFRALSMETGISLFRLQIEKGMKEWLKAFEAIGEELKLDSKTAKDYAYQSMIDIQGSLILTSTLNNPQIFEEALQRITSRYLT